MTIYYHYSANTSHLKRACSFIWPILHQLDIEIRWAIFCWKWQRRYLIFILSSLSLLEWDVAILLHKFEFHSLIDALCQVNWNLLSGFLDDTNVRCDQNVKSLQTERQTDRKLHTTSDQKSKLTWSCKLKWSKKESIDIVYKLFTFLLIIIIVCTNVIH